MNLQHDLERERIYWLHKQPAPVSAVERMALDWLGRSGMEGKALRVGERAPGFRLPDQSGALVSLESRLALGPVVLLFFRGHWCPFCSLTLRSYQKAAPRFAALRSPLLAISPQGAVANGESSQRLGTSFPLLSDVGSHVNRAYGLAYDLPAGLRALFEGEYATPLPEINSDGGWTLPLPATYVIGQDGMVLYAHVDVDFRRRQDPEELLAWLGARYADVGARGSL
ncbi:peroxiredoxin-like family protein [Hydrocarboniphaga sp.]|uniref:peroxiredoxin-like family protein n=1 Tax=Hydrocarboniphaga sp. TaxID=2033016 RepID=UPI003D0A535D